MDVNHMEAKEDSIELQHAWDVLAKELGEAYLQLDLVLAHIAKLKQQLGALSAE